jgi:hypothetical protein
LHVFVFGGDGDAFSIGGNHVNHTARKNIKMTYAVMDNFVYGLTKKQTSPTSPIGFKSKTDTWGAVDQPINPMKQLIAAGATFVARTTHTNPNHVFVVEMNDEGLYGYGQLAGLLRARFCDPKIRGLTKTDGLHFKVREILERAKTTVAAGIEKL